MKSLGPRQSFRREIVIAMSAAFAVSAVGSALLIIYITRDRTFSLGRDQAASFVAAVAPKMAYGLLIEGADRSVAEKALRESTQRPDVVFAGLYGLDGAEVVQLGDPEISLPRSAVFDLRKENEVVVKSSRHWHAVAPVVLTSSLTIEGPAKPTVLGHLYVVWSHAPYQALHDAIVVATTIGAVTSLLAGLSWIAWRSRRLTKPIVDLAKVMDLGTINDSITAPLTGTAEIDRIADAFNRLMTRLADHRGILEQTVAQRTSALRQTNDELRVAIADAQQAERFKSAFLAAVSHEMKTPLHAIDAGLRDALHELEFVSDDATASEVRAHLLSVIGQKEQLLTQINQILDYARAKAGRHTLNWRQLDCVEFTRQINKLFQPIAKSRHNKLTVRHIGNDSFVTDCEKLNAITINLLSNACNFTSHGRVEMFISVMDRQMLLAVEDTGCGIDSSLIDSVWEEFRQADMGENRSKGGTGLGLAVTKAFVELLGGSAAIESTLGVGTRVTVQIPARDQFVHSPSKGKMANVDV